MRTKKYKDFFNFTKSKTILWFKKKLIIGPDYLNLLGTFVLLNISSIFIILIFSLIFFKIISSILLVLVNITMFIVSFKDAGIIPRNNNINYKKIPYKEDNENLIKNYFLNLNGKKFNIKKCYTCLIYKPYLTIHCRICNNCIIKFDHHCPWLSNCIGKKNYLNFVIYLIFLFIYTYTLLGFWIYNFYINFEKKILKNFIFVIFLLIIIFGNIFSSSLLIFHSYLMINKITTNYYFKNKEKYPNYLFKKFKNYFIDYYYKNDSLLELKIKKFKNQEFMNYNFLNENKNISCIRNNKIEQT